MGLATVAISNLPASRSRTRTGVGALRPNAIRRADQHRNSDGGKPWTTSSSSASTCRRDGSISPAAGTRRIAKTPEAIAAWAAELDPAAVALVAFEPTGGYERALRQALRRRGPRFARVHPNEVAAFRQRRGRKAKTDPIDAALLAEFAALELAQRGLAPLV